MVTQRNPKTGDIVESLLWTYGEPIQCRYLRVTNIVELKGGSLVQLKYFMYTGANEDLNNKVAAEEYMLYFSHFFNILEYTNENTLKVLYGL